MKYYLALGILKCNNTISGPLPFQMFWLLDRCPTTNGFGAVFCVCVPFSSLFYESNGIHPQVVPSVLDTPIVRVMKYKDIPCNVIFGGWHYGDINVFNNLRIN